MRITGSVVGCRLRQLSLGVSADFYQFAIYYQRDLFECFPLRRMPTTAAILVTESRQTSAQIVTLRERAEITKNHSSIKVVFLLLLRLLRLLLLFF